MHRILPTHSSLTVPQASEFLKKSHGQVDVTGEPGLVAFMRGQWGVAGAMHLSYATGRVWYEVEVVEDKGFAIVGIAGTNFRDNDVGIENNASWGIDSRTGMAFHNRQPTLHLTFTCILMPIHH